MFTKGGKRYCDAYNSEGGCSSVNCDMVHACKICRRLGHSMLTCVDTERSKGKGGDKSRGKSKGKEGR